MKRRNGFTLIELLAIIIILAIIAVITIPVVLNVIDNAKKETAIDSAQGYKKAIDQYYLNKMMLDDDYDVLDDEYEISIYKSDGLTVTGDEPSEGWVKVVNAEVTDFSFKIGDYIITYDSKTNSIETVKGTQLALTPSMQIIEEKVNTYVKAALTANSSLTSEVVKKVTEMSEVTTNAPDSGWIHFNTDNNSVVIEDYSLTYGNITANYQSLTDNKYISTFGEARNKPIIVGSQICYGPTESQECFKIIKVFTQEGTEKAMLFANYNLKKDTTTDPVTYKQDADSLDTIAFSGSAYWMDKTTTPNTLKSAYSNNGAYSYDEENNIFIDTNNTRVYPNIYDSNSYTYAYVEGYLITLKTSTYGLPSSATGRILYYDEANDTSIFANSTARANGKDYWLGSASDNYNVRVVVSRGNTRNSSSFGSGSRVRPVIIIPTSDF